MFKRSFNLRILSHYYSKRFAGHSKWANIKHTKTLKDEERSRMFTKLSQQIKVAIHEGGSINPATNVKLEQIVAQARRSNMPVQTIEGVIKSTQKDKTQMKSYTFEIKGPGSSIILCEVCSPNVVKTKNEISTILRKHHLKYADGGGRHLFEYKGVIETEMPDVDKDKIVEVAENVAIECEAEDVCVTEENLLQFTCESHNFMKIQKHLEQLGYKIITASLAYIPIRQVPLSNADIELCSKFFDKLRSQEDVIALYDNIA